MATEKHSNHFNMGEEPKLWYELVVKNPLHIPLLVGVAGRPCFGIFRPCFGRQRPRVPPWRPRPCVRFRRSRARRPVEQNRELGCVSRNLFGSVRGVKVVKVSVMVSWVPEIWTPGPIPEMGVTSGPWSSRDLSFCTGPPAVAEDSATPEEQLCHMSHAGR